VQVAHADWHELERFQRERSNVEQNEAAETLGGAHVSFNVRLRTNCWRDCTLQHQGHHSISVSYKVTRFVNQAIKDES